MMKIKLVAIAKDEAAYLPEWIYHHLNVGFDAITVLTNSISDNTREVLKKISEHYPVEDINVDYINTCISKGFQRMAYGIELQRSKEQGFTHVMFLDVDEYWVTKDAGGSIKDYLMDLGDPEILVFPWLLLAKEQEFQSSFTEKNHLVASGLVKTIFKTSVQIDLLRIHNIVSSTSEAIFTNGDIFSKKGEDRKICIPDYKNIPKAFILHRFYRSQMEYVSLLARGNPDTKEEMLKLKTNRHGYFVDYDKCLIWELSPNDVEVYNSNFKSFVDMCGLTDAISKAKNFICNRFLDVLETVRVSEDYPKSFYLKIFNGVVLKEVINAYTNNVNFKNDVNFLLPEIKPDVINYLKNIIDVDDDFVGEVRDIGISYKTSNLMLAGQFMMLAHMLRPTGPLIKSELVEIQDLISKGVEKIKKEEDFEELLPIDDIEKIVDSDSQKSSYGDFREEKAPAFFILSLFFMIALIVVIIVL